MKTYKFIIAALLSGSTILMTGCINDFLNLKPLDSETEAVYFETLEQFQAAANHLHTNVLSWHLMKPRLPKPRLTRIMCGSIWERIC